VVSVAKSGISCDSTVSISGQLSVLSISSTSELDPEQVLLPELYSVSSPADGSRDPSPQLPQTPSALVLASVPHQLPDSANPSVSTSTYSSDAADTV
jgi:hypothetical protein